MNSSGDSLHGIGTLQSLACGWTASDHTVLLLQRGVHFFRPVPKEYLHSAELRDIMQV